MFSLYCWSFFYRSTSNTNKVMSHLLHLFLLILHLPWIYKTNLSIILNQSSVIHQDLHSLPTDTVFLIPSYSSFRSVYIPLQQKLSTAWCQPHALRLFGYAAYLISLVSLKTHPLPSIPTTLALFKFQQIMSFMSSQSNVDCHYICKECDNKTITLP